MYGPYRYVLLMLFASLTLEMGNKNSSIIPDHCRSNLQCRCKTTLLLSFYHWARHKNRISIFLMIIVGNRVTNSSPFARNRSRVSETQQHTPIVSLRLYPPCYYAHKTEHWFGIMKGLINIKISFDSRLKRGAVFWIHQQYSFVQGKCQPWLGIWGRR